MASRRLIVFGFVRDYLTRMGGSPSIGEIAAGCGISRTRARQLVLALVRAGQLTRRAGPRGLGMPADRDKAIRRLRELGWQVDEDHHSVTAPQGPNSTLLAITPLDYDPDSEGQAGQLHGEGVEKQ